MSIGEKFEVIADEVYAKGKEDERYNFWKDFPAGWCIQYCFSYSSWTDDIYNPIKDIVVPQGTYFSAMYHSSHITDTKVTLDLSACHDKYTGGTTNVFRESNIKTIRKIIVNENIAFYNWFKLTKYLENITFEGVIGNDIDFVDCPLLTKASIKNIFEHLSRTTSGKTLTLSKTAVNTAFSINVDDETTYTEEWNTLINSVSNWTLSFA